MDRRSFLKVLLASPFFVAAGRLLGSKEKNQSDEIGAVEFGESYTYTYRSSVTGHASNPSPVYQFVQPGYIYGVDGPDFGPKYDLVDIYTVGPSGPIYSHTFSREA